MPALDALGAGWLGSITPVKRSAGAGLQTFDYVVANPMWNQDNYDETFYENDPWKRFGLGSPPRGSADWGWAQHILASLNKDGRAAIVLDTGAASRGSGNANKNKEKEVRKHFVEQDLVEGVVYLPENLFYNTSAPGIGPSTLIFCVSSLTASRRS